VYQAGVLVTARLGYNTLNSSPESGVMTFNTGRSMSSWAGQDLTATMVETGNGSTTVIMGGSLARHGAQIQLVSWGEKTRLINKWLDALGEALQLQPLEPLAGGTEEGWYPDPSGRYPDRWWDGNAWADYTRDKPGGTRFDDPAVV
jgi:hypothetical protein